ALMLQNQGRLTAGQLAAELEVSVRTIYRDMVALGAAGIPVYADGTGYRLVDGYQTRLTGLTGDEARGLVLAELPGAAAELGLAGAANAVRLKLAAALPDQLRQQAMRMRQRFHFDAPGWYQDGDGSDHLGTVADAVWRQRAIAIRYENWRGVVSRRLEPYGLVLKAGKWYLVAHAGESNLDQDESDVDRPAGSVRTYRVSQIQHLTLLPETFDWPAGFDLAGYWREHITRFRSQLHRGQALVRLAPAAVQRLDHLMGRTVAEAAAAGEPQPDGWLLARLPIESQAHAAQEFLRLGTDIEVLEPAALRHRLAATAAGLAALYARQ
ncbi:MAG: transcriptional regulator, partial [Micromonosporaceae bacterium]|nr:transcriptional regulator [Micromonosporaceae bacterium]